MGPLLPDCLSGFNAGRGESASFCPIHLLRLDETLALLYYAPD